MAATATKLIPATEPTLLERLLQEREQAADSIKRLTGVSARLHSEADAGASLIDELAKLAETETNDMRAWADAGAQGPVPKGKQTERQAIAVKMAGTNASAAAARGAIADTDAQIADLNSRFQAIGQQIEQSAFDILEVEHSQLLSDYRANCEQGAKLAAKLHGLASYYGDTGRNLLSRGEQDAGARYLSRASALTNIKLPSPGVSRNEIETAASGWAHRAADLRKGPAS